MVLITKIHGNVMLQYLRIKVPCRIKVGALAYELKWDVHNSMTYINSSQIKVVSSTKLQGKYEFLFSMK